MSDWLEDRQALNEHQKEENHQAVEHFLTVVKPALEAAGFIVRNLGDTSTHFRVNGRLDLFPVRKRFHFIGHPQQRGRYVDAMNTCQMFLRAASKKA